MLFVACAELLTIYDAKAGIALHVIILFVLLFHSALESDEDKNLSRFLMVLVLAPLVRILSLSMPLVHFSRISGFILISIPIFIAIFTCMWVQELRPKDVGLSLPKLKHTLNEEPCGKPQGINVHIPTATAATLWQATGNPQVEAGVILFAIPVGMIEYQILKPAPLPIGSGVPNFITLLSIFIVCTGFLEELTFRGLIPLNAIKLMSKWWGILFVTTIFGVLHVGNLALLDCLLAFSIGFIFSVVREKTGSIYGISVSHGIINIILFLVAPLYVIFNHIYIISHRIRMKNHVITNGNRN
uniref:CAAX prenyl protease 2/Lysostaphin resistance protein A-like domain-containing protein n=1 Tax=Candidatus Methanophagaceae archaeon ANME-1 ERB6 TaxID=2759912 RepID=A0A7G9Z106_9EURY|nr:hypothetical protein NNHBGCAA_00040 [Methanosarcinales archaeon ANME-1 ERB6]